MLLLKLNLLFKFIFIFDKILIVITYLGLEWVICEDLEDL